MEHTSQTNAMIRKITWKGSAQLSPVPPVLVTCAQKGYRAAENADAAAGPRANVLTVAWTGIINSQPPKTYISVRPERFSYDIIRESGEFALNLTTVPMVRAVDYCGVRSGREVDKFQACHLGIRPASAIACPILEDSPLSLECRVFEVMHLGSHDMFLADIVAVDVNEELIGPDGRLHLEHSGLIAYSHGEYFALGKKLGSFGYTVAKRKKDTNRRR